MSWKKILVLATILLVLVMAINLNNRKEIKYQIKENVLLDFPAAKIAKIELRQKDLKFVFARKGSLWYLEEPLSARADKISVESILDDFCPLQYERLVEENARNLKNYGLDRPEIELKIFAKDLAAPMHTILLGMKNNLDSLSYAKVAGDNKVVLIAAYKRINLEKNLFAFRDKKILVFDVLTVVSINYLYENNNFVFNKRNNQWFMDKPVFSLVREEKISEILSATARLEAKAFAGAANIGSRRAFNLEKPLLIVEFKTTAASKKIMAGKKGERYYTLAEGLQEICEIEKDFCETFSRDRSAFRENKIATFLAFDVRKLGFRNDALEFTIEKNATNSWELLTPLLQIKLSEEKIEKLLAALADCKAREFIDNPKGTFAFTTSIKLQLDISQTPGQAKNLELDFSGAKADTVIVRNPALPYWFKVDKKILEKLPKRITNLSLLN